MNKNFIYSNQLFDFVFWFIITPFFIWCCFTPYLNIITIICICLIIACHIRILYKRYLQSVYDVKWPICCEPIAILCGLFMTIDGILCIKYNKIFAILSLIGLLIIFGHSRKMLYPSKSYYYTSNQV